MGAHPLGCMQLRENVSNWGPQVVSQSHPRRVGERAVVPSGTHSFPRRTVGTDKKIRWQHLLITNCMKDPFKANSLLWLQGHSLVADGEAAQTQII